jgi:hypothetical protein
LLLFNVLQAELAILGNAKGSASHGALKNHFKCSGIREAVSICAKTGNVKIYGMPCCGFQERQI